MITIISGVSNSVSREVSQYPTVSSVLSDANLKSFLGFGDNVEARVNGAVALGTQTLKDGDSVQIVTAANTKG